MQNVPFSGQDAAPPVKDGPAWELAMGLVGISRGKLTPVLDLEPRAAAVILLSSGGRLGHIPSGNVSPV